MAVRIRLDEDLRRFRTAMDATGDAIFLIDRASTCFVDVNATACRMLGYERDDFLGCDGERLHVEVRSRLHDLLDKLRRRRTGRRDGRTAARARATARTVSVEVQRRTLRSGASWILVAVARDITERKRRAGAAAAAGPLRYPDRAAQPQQVLFRTARGALQQAEENRWAVGVLFLDIDRFKTVNDTLGHPVGDELLRQFSARLVDSLRSRDTVGRFGGDEFAAIMVLPDGPQTRACR